MIVLRKITLFVLFCLSLVFLASFTLADYNITNCVSISEQGVYNIVNDMNISGDCFEIGSDGVIINGLGHKIISDSKGRAFDIRDSNHVEIYNISLHGFDQAIYLDDVSNSNFYNIYSYIGGIKTRAGDENIFNNIVLEQPKIGFSFLANRDFIVNNANVNNSEIAFKLSDSYGSTFSNNEIRNSELAFYIYGGSLNNLFLSNIIINSEDSFEIDASRDIFVFDSNLSDSSNSIKVSDSSVVYLYNVSYDDAEEVESSSKLFRGWYLNALALDMNNSFLNDASFVLRDDEGHLVFSDISDQNGSAKIPVLEYINNGRRNIYHNIYSIYAYNAHYSSDNYGVSINGNSNISLILSNLIEPESKIILSDFNTNPLMPLITNKSENISINFSSNIYPLYVSISLLSGDNLLEKIENYTVLYNERYNINYSLPNNLSEGNYSLNVLLRSKKGDQKEFSVGPIIVEYFGGSNSSQNNTGGNGDGSGNNPGGSSSGGGGGSRAKIVNVSLNNSVNLNTNPIGQPNKSSNSNGNESVSDSVENKNKGFGSLITGAFIGAIDNKSSLFVVVVLVLLILAYVILVIHNKVIKANK